MLLGQPTPRRPCRCSIPTPQNEALLSISIVMALHHRSSPGPPVLGGSLLCASIHASKELVYIVTKVEVIRNWGCVVGGEGGSSAGYSRAISMATVKFSRRSR